MKENNKVLAIIKSILREAKEEGCEIGKTRFVKLLYLVEVEYYRLCQKRLTDLEWKFLHYGPYPPAIEEILGSPDIEQIEIDLPEDKTLHKLTLVRESQDDYCSDPNVLRLIKQVAEEWVGVRLNILLDYVYFETEPMAEVKRGDILDFAKIKPLQEEKIRKIRIDAKEIKAIRESIMEHTKASTRPEIVVKGDKTLVDCIRIWDGDSHNVPITGEIKLSTDEEE